MVMVADGFLDGLQDASIQEEHRKCSNKKVSGNQNFAASCYQDFEYGGWSCGICL